MKKQETPDAILAHALALGVALGVPEREIARSALKVAVTIAHKHGDPDGFLRMIMPTKEGV